MDLLLPDNTPLELDRMRIIGVLNLTPDSFYDGGQHADTAQAISHGLSMAAAGADIIDIGGESTRPGAGRIDASQQIPRVVPVVRALRQQLDLSHRGVQISIDTTLAEVAQAAVQAGATILNDVSAGTEDPGMLPLAAERGLPIILMHMLGEPGTMQDRPTYKDVVAEVSRFLLDRAQAALQAGIDRQRIILDPGIGFGKTLEHNLSLLGALKHFLGLGYPILIGASRKRFIGSFGGSSRQANPSDRLGGTCAVTAHCAAMGVQLVRVHDVEANKQAAELALAIQRAGRSKTS